MKYYKTATDIRAIEVGQEHLIQPDWELLTDEQLEDLLKPTDEQLAEQIRSKRDYLITQTDYLVMPDYPISAEQLEAVRTYRQALRDVTTQDTFPQSVIWPVKPDI